MDSLVTPNSYYHYLEKRFQLNQIEQAYSLVRVAIGIGLRHIIESVKADEPDLKINRVVKDEVREVAGVSISSLDKYLGEAFHSERQIDVTTLDKLAGKLFYKNNSSLKKRDEASNLKFLQQRHIGILGNIGEQGPPKQFISDLITFIKSKPSLIESIQENLDKSKHPEMIVRVFELSTQATTVPIGSGSRATTLPSASKAVRLNTSVSLVAAVSVFVLGVLFPVLILVKSSAHPSLVLDYLVHDPGKHFFHIVMFPCMVWAFFRCMSIEPLRDQKPLFLVLLCAGFVSSIAQTYV